MQLIFEGVDAVGKSTIADKLSDQLSLLQIRGSSFTLATSSNEKLYSHFLKLAKVKNVIVQRSIYSNRVYATLFKDYSILTHEQRSHIEDLIKDDSIVIYLTADSDTIINRLEERGDEYIKTDHVKDILGMYETTMSDAKYNGITVLTYDTSKLTSDEIVDKIINVLKDQCEE